MKRLLILMCSLLALCASAADNTILQRADAFRTPLDSFSVDLELTAVNGSRSEVQRMRVFAKGHDRSRVEFTYPATEKGKALLMLRDAMWIFLPSASKPIRISPMQRLMGQASNGDVARTSFATDYSTTKQSRVQLDGREAWELELEAKDPSTAYGKVTLWVDATTSEPIRADFRVTSGKLVKRAHYREYAVMNGRRSLVRVEIEDLLRTGQRTTMKYSNLTTHDNPDRLFLKESLGR
jgi:outer membrane lipoprotein-sorting protein